MTEFSMFCRGKNCPEYIEWDYGYGPCESCKLIGQSHSINQYPANCLFLDEIKEFEKLEPEDFKDDRI